MYAHVNGASLLMSSIETYRVVLVDSGDFIVTTDEVTHYELRHTVLIKKEKPYAVSEHDLRPMTIPDYVRQYPERHDHVNRLDQFSPMFRRTSTK